MHTASRSSTTSTPRRPRPARSSSSRTGWGEHAGRYAALIDALTADGYTVYADDHRGHGRTGMAQHGGDADEARATRTRWASRWGRRAVAVHARLIRSENPDASARALRALGRVDHRADADQRPPRWPTTRSCSAARRCAFPDRSTPADSTRSGQTERGDGDRVALLRPRGGQGLHRGSADDDDAGRRSSTAWLDQLRFFGRPRKNLGHDIPALLLVGRDDPVGGPRSVHKLADAYRKRSGLTDVTTLVYPDARHEIFNETDAGRRPRRPARLARRALPGARLIRGPLGSVSIPLLDLRALPRQSGDVRTRGSALTTSGLSRRRGCRRQADDDPWREMKPPTTHLRRAALAVAGTLAVTIAALAPTVAGAAEDDGGLAGSDLWLNPYSTTLEAAQSLSGQARADAQLLGSIPSANWITKGTPAEAQAAVDEIVDAASARDEMPVIVAYNLPYRDCAQYSAGGAANTADYKAWIDGVAAGIGGRAGDRHPRARRARDHPVLHDHQRRHSSGVSPPSSTSRDGGIRSLRAAELRGRRAEGRGEHLRLPRRHRTAAGSASATSPIACSRAASSDADGFFLNASNYQFTTRTRPYYGTWVSSCIALT